MNPKYGRFGVLGYPYWFLFEWLVHIIEFIGILYFVMVILFGDPNWSFFGVMFGFIYTFAVAQSVWSILFEELTYHKYTKRTDVIKLVFTAFLEPVFYHPFILYWAIRGNLDYLSGNKSWGVMVRKGFGAMRAFLRSF
jgi:hypothetical protein